MHDNCDHQICVVGRNDHRGLPNDPRLPLHQQVLVFFCDYFSLFFFTINRWLIGGFQVPTNANSLTNSFNSAMDKFGEFASGRPLDDKVAVGIFLDCVKPEGSLVSVLFLPCYNVAQVTKWL